METLDLQWLRETELKWQRKWSNNRLFVSKLALEKPKYYVLEMFPYPSGEMHMGHVRNYSIGDAFARFKRMQGYCVLYPMGFDSFGLPAENAAIKHGIHPQRWTETNIALIKDGLLRMGFSYDWNREVRTCTPEYYKWNQWFFLKFYERGLAYRKKAYVNWCDNCKTVLANEQVVGGKCWRCSSEVSHRELEQWFLAITKYAEELLQDLQKLENWPNKVRLMQENWIGKSVGTEVLFKVMDSDQTLLIFTSRIDTIFGCTFVALTPTHPAIKDLVHGSNSENAVRQYVAARPRAIQGVGADASGERTGVFTGRYGINPMTGEPCPIYVANYVLMEYGTGAIMGVPGHDKKDLDFATRYGLSVKTVIEPANKDCQTISRHAIIEDGILVNSRDFSGLPSAKARELIQTNLEKAGIGRPKVNYRLQDWLISRQRYWGTPIPVVYCTNCGIVPVPEQQLPVELPKDVTFDKGGNPIEASSEFVKTDCPKCHEPALRETDTMDTFFDSSWYYLRYCDPTNVERPFSNEVAQYWMPVDQYIGGVEHAILHLLYSRFFVKVLRDFGLVQFDEPFLRLLTQGMVLKDGYAMSKSKGNLVSPTDIVQNYSADILRLFILSAALPETELEWSERDISSSVRFISRFWRLVSYSLSNIEDDTVEAEATLYDNYLEAMTRKTIEGVTRDLESLRMSSAITALSNLIDVIFEYLQSDFNKQSGLVRNCIGYLTLMLSPFIPHLCEEAWTLLGHSNFISTANWPALNIENSHRKVLEIVQTYEKVLKDIREIARITGRPLKKVHVYVVPPDRERFQYLKEYLKRHLNVETELYSTQDATKYDPENKSKVAKIGKPGIYLQ